MQLSVLLKLLALPVSHFKEADYLTRSLRQYDGGFVLAFGRLLGFSVHGFDL
jgi:hypothetical protein